jgi:hypothetical protein
MSGKSFVLIVGLLAHPEAPAANRAGLSPSMIATRPFSPCRPCARRTAEHRKPLARFEDGHLRAVPLGPLSRIGLEPMLAGLAPHDPTDAGPAPGA